MCHNIFSKINFRKHHQSIIFYVGNLFCIALLTNETVYEENKNKHYTKLFFYSISTYKTTFLLQNTMRY